MKYTITGIGAAQGVVAFSLVLGDGTTYPKKMMADLSSKEGLFAQIEGWASQYESDRLKVSVPVAVTALVGVPQNTATRPVVVKAID